MTKHSPGPWIYYIRDDNYLVIMPKGLPHEYPHIAYIIPNDTASEIRQANAKLIAAAPSYYDLIEEILNAELSANVLRILQPWLQKAETIHAKATS